MTRFGYHCSQEQFSPRAMLEYVRAAERAGFEGAMSADHFHPWTRRHDNVCGFTWSWLGAALQATGLSMGVVTTPVGWRYHPAVIAQATATLAQMYPGRFWVAVGSGEAVNEHITGDRWPAKPERNARLLEGIDVMRALWQGETVSRDGPVPVDRARVYVRAQPPPLVVGAALSPETARMLAPHVDALITINMPDGKTGRVLDAFRRGGGEGKPAFLQVHLSWAGSEEEALRQAHEEWATNVAPGDLAEDIKLPERFDRFAGFVRPEDVRPHVQVSADLDEHVERLSAWAGLGFDEVFLHNVGRNQHEFLDAFGKRVLPALGSA